MQEPEDTAYTASHYHTYLLRCWQERSSQAGALVTVWRFSLENPHTGQRRGFASLEALLASLQTDLVEEEDQL